MNPYLLVEFKPALGHIFDDFISGYSHWGYSDLDIAFGDLPRWVTAEELEYYDIVTYGYGDQHRVYLRGQFTFHKNNLKIKNLWRKCDHLVKMDTRLQSIISGQEKFQFQSAEGCYSYVVLESSDIKVKYASKALTNLPEKESYDTANLYGLKISKGTNGKFSVVYKAGPGTDGRSFLRLSNTWFQDSQFNLIYSNSQIPLQSEVDKRIELTSNSGIVCMQWVPKIYQSNLCIAHVSSQDTVLLLNGKLYKQKFIEAMFPCSIETKAFFHFQEWKRSYTSNQLWPFKMFENTMFKAGLLEKIVGWTLFQEGAVPNLSISRQVENKSSMNNLDLPSQEFCLYNSKQSQRNQRYQHCDWVISWHDEIVQKFFGKNWLLGYRPKDTDVTLTMTLQMSQTSVSSNEDVNVLLNIVEMNILNWKNQPIILVISLNGIGKRLSTLVKKRIVHAAKKCKQCLIGIIGNKSNVTEVLENAIVNMAEAASPTRWTITGLDINQGSIMSEESYIFAKRLLSVYKYKTGYAFLLPVITVGTEKNISSISLPDIIDVISKSTKKELGIRCDNLHCTQESELESLIFNSWWYLTKFSVGQNGSLSQNILELLSKKLRRIVKQANYIFLNKTEGLPPGRLNVAVISDKMGLSSTTADEINICPMTLRLIHLSMLQYNILPIAGAFVYVTKSSSKGFQENHSYGEMNRIQRLSTAKIALYNEVQNELN